LTDIDNINHTQFKQQTIIHNLQDHNYLLYLKSNNKIKLLINNRDILYL